MIRFTENKEQIISLWQEVFGDSREDVEFFLNNCKIRLVLDILTVICLLQCCFLLTADIAVTAENIFMQYAQERITEKEAMPPS